MRMENYDYLNTLIMRRILPQMVIIILHSPFSILHYHLYFTFTASPLSTSATWCGVMFTFPFMNSGML